MEKYLGRFSLSRFHSIVENILLKNGIEMNQREIEFFKGYYKFKLKDIVNEMEKVSYYLLITDKLNQKNIKKNHEKFVKITIIGVIYLLIVENRLKEKITKEKIADYFEVDPVAVTKAYHKIRSNFGEYIQKISVSVYFKGEYYAFISLRSGVEDVEDYFGRKGNLINMFTGEKVSEIKKGQTLKFVPVKTKSKGCRFLK